MHHQDKPLRLTLLKTHKGFMYIVPVTLLAIGALLVMVAVTQKSVLHHKTTRAMHAYKDAKLNAVAAMKNAERLIQQSRAQFPAEIEIVNQQDITGVLGHPQTLFELQVAQPITHTRQTITLHRSYLKYSALLVAPKSAVLLSNRLPRLSNVTIIASQPPLAGVLQGQGDLISYQWCQQSAPQLCETRHMRSLPAIDDLSQVLFNRASQSLSPEIFLNSYELSDCDDLRAPSHTVIWVTGDCELAVNSVLGTETQPVLLVVNDGQLRMSGGQHIFGMVVLLQRNSIPQLIHISDTAAIEGTLVVNGQLATGSKIRVLANTAVIKTLQRSKSFVRTIAIPGSYRDF